MYNHTSLLLLVTVLSGRAFTSLHGRLLPDALPLYKGIKKGELPRLKCFHNGIILIVICFQLTNLIHNTIKPNLFTTQIHCEANDNL